MSTTYQTTSAAGAAYDQGLRAYMLRVYDLVGVGLAISTLSAWLIYSLAITRVPVGGAIEGGKALSKTVWLTPLGTTLFSGTSMLILFVVTIGLIFAIAGAVRSASFGVGLALYGVFTALIGYDLALLVAKYTTGSIVQALAATTATFGAMSLWGYTTKRNLSGWGHFLFMGLVGMIIVGLLNALFFHSPATQMAMSYVGVLLFVGLTAYDTQNIKNAYSAHMGSDEMNRVALWGALDLYLDAVNLFVHLLQIMGKKED